MKWMTLVLSSLWEEYTRRQCMLPFKSFQAHARVQYNVPNLWDSSNTLLLVCTIIPLIDKYRKWCYSFLLIRKLDPEQTADSSNRTWKDTNSISGYLIRSTCDCKTYSLSLCIFFFFFQWDLHRTTLSLTWSPRWWGGQNRRSRWTWMFITFL